MHHRSGIFLFALLIASFGFVGCTGLVSGNNGNPPPPSTLVITNVQTGSVTTAGSQIIWTTNVPASSSVDYGTSSSYGTSTPVDSAMVTSHQMTLSGLATGTTYYYQVNSTDSTNNHGKSFGHSFATRGFSLSGTINPTAAGNGAAVALSGTASASATADSAGNFTFAGLPDGSYMVTPTHSGYAFAPGNQSATVNGANVAGLNFTGNAATVAPTITTQPANQTVTAGQTATFTAVAAGTAPLGYQWQKNGASIAGATSASYTTPATTIADSGSTFAVVVTNTAGTVTSSVATLTVNAAPVAPSITTQPANQTVTAGQTASFSVAATGTAPLSYQWRKNSVAISGATSSSYTTPATTSSDNGAQFTVLVTNTAGSMSSNAATLTVNAAPVAPSIMTQPASQTVTAGQTATFTVVAGGTAPLSYQWQKNGANIAGATSASYTTAVTTAADSGSTFRVVVSNTAGTVTSAAATLTVNTTDTTPPSVPTGLGATAVSSSEINLSWTASTDNVGVAGYNVYRGGTQIATSGSTSYFDSGLTASSSYSYTVAAFDAAGNTSAQSSSASATTQASTGGGGVLYPNVGWTQLPNTAIESFAPNYMVYPVTGNACGGGPSRCVVSDWSSAWNDTKRSRMVMWGGGHQDYHGNEVYTLDIRTGVMARATNPSYPYGNSSELNSDGTPNIRHTYDTMAYVGGSHDYYFQYSGALGGNGFAGTNFITLQPNLTSWTSTAPTQGTNGYPSGYQGLSADYDPITDRVYMVDVGSFGYYDPNKGSQANSFTYLSTMTVVDYKQNCAVDRDNRLFVCIGDNQYWKWDLTQANPAQQVFTPTGCGTGLSSPFPYMAYYPYRHQFAILGSSTSTVYLLNAVTNTCTAATMNGGPAIDNSIADGLKLFGYYPAVGVFALVSNVPNTNAYILRLDAGAGNGVGGGSASGLEYSFALRAAAAGNLGAQNFDTNNFLNSSGALNNLGNCDNSLQGGGPRECFYDTSISNSGAGSLRLDCPGLTDADCSGDWNFWLDPANHTNFAGNSEWYVQFHVRGNSQLFTTDWFSVVSSAPKHFIMHQGSPSFVTCGQVEITEVQNGGGGAQPFPSGYTQCGAKGFQDESTVLPQGQCSSSNPCVEQGPTPTTGYWALYPAYQRAFRYSDHPNEWLVEYWHIKFGTPGGADSQVDAYIAPVGQPLVQFVRMRNFTFNVDPGCPGSAGSGSACSYNMITFLLYMTGKNASAPHPTASMWIDELITSTQKIPAPYGPTP